MTDTPAVKAVESETEPISDKSDSISAVFESPDDESSDDGECFRRLFDLNTNRSESQPALDTDTPISIHFEEYEIYSFATEEGSYRADELAFGRRGRRRRTDEMNSGLHRMQKMQAIREIIIQLRCELILVILLLLTIAALLYFVLKRF